MMADHETVLWNEAAGIADLAMGKRDVRDGRRIVQRHNSDDDPLAWWCLTELLVSFAEKHAADITSRARQENGNG